MLCIIFHFFLYVFDALVNYSGIFFFLEIFLLLLTCLLVVPTVGKLQETNLSLGRDYYSGNTGDVAFSLNLVIQNKPGHAKSLGFILVSSFMECMLFSCRSQSINTIVCLSLFSLILNWGRANSSIMCR